MNVIACVKQIPDIQQIRIRRETREPVLEDLPLTFGAIDKNAIEEGVRLQEKLGGKVTLVSAGSEELEETIKEGLAMGADEAFLVMDNKLDGAGSDVIAEVLAKAIQKIGEYDLIILGEGSSDNYSGQVGPCLAEALGLPLVTFVKSLEVDGGKIRLERNLEDCFEVVEVELPAVVMVMSEINEARIPAITQILKAARKPKQIVEPDELGIDLESVADKVKTISNLAPEQERKQIIFQGDIDTAVSDMLKALQNDGLIGGQ